MATINDFDTFPSSFFEWNAPWLEAASWGHYLLAVLGLVLTFIVILSCVRQTCAASLLLIFLLCWADLLLCLSMVIISATDFGQKRFTAGKTGCILFACLCLYSCYMSITALAAVTLERYFSICHNKNMSRKTALWIILGIMSSGVILVAWPVFIGQYDVYALQPSLQVCVLGFWNRNPYALIENTLCLITILGGAFVMVLCYGLIFQTYSAARKSMPMTMVDSGMSGVKMMQETKRKEAERRLLVKCIAISGLYLTCWLPYAVKAFYEIATGKPLDQFLDYWCAMSALANSALNPMFLIAFDNRIRANVVRMFIRRAESP